MPSSVPLANPHSSNRSHAARRRSPPTADIISTVEFDSTGNYLATGDKGGRVVLFERNEMVRPTLSLPITISFIVRHITPL